MHLRCAVDAEDHGEGARRQSMSLRGSPGLGIDDYPESPYRSLPAILY